MNKASLLALLALTALAAVSAVMDTEADMVELGVDAEMMNQDNQFAALKCETDVATIAAENKKNRPVMIKELHMIQTVKHHLGKLINTKEEREQVEISNIDMGTDRSKDTLAGLIADVSSGQGRSYTETSQIQTLLAQLEHKLIKALKTQRHLLLSAVHNCMHICRDRHHAHRTDLLSARDARRKARIKYHGLERTYFRLKGEWEALVKEYNILKIETEKKIKVIDTEMGHLVILQQKILKYLDTNRGEATTDLEVDMGITDEDTARIGDLAKASDDLPMLADLVNGLQVLSGNPNLSAAQRRGKANQVKTLLQELCDKLRAEKEELLRILRLKWEEMKAKEREMNIAKAAMEAYRPTLKRRKVRVAELTQLCEQADAKCTQLEQSRYLTETADGGQETAHEKEAHNRVNEEVKDRKTKLKEDHNRLKTQEGQSDSKDEETDRNHQLVHPVNQLQVGEAMDNDQYE